MSTYGPRFITPPTEDQETYPYLPIWRSLIIETAVLAVLVVVLFLLVNVLRFSIPTRIQSYLAIGLSLAPMLAWSVFSWLAEQRTDQPRKRLMSIVILTMLVTNSIALPLISQFFQVDSWLPLAPAINRIVGYTLTTGIVQGIVKYLVIRYTIWPNHLRIRFDGVAYGIASGIGYATVQNIQFIMVNSPTPVDTLAFQIFANYALHVSTGIIIGYSLSETFFSNPTPIFLPSVVALGSVITGIAIPIHAGLVNSSLSISSVSAQKPLFGFGFSIALLLVVSIIIAGLIANADRLERESRSEREE